MLVESDDSLVQRAQAGDMEAFRVLVERHTRSVFRLAFRLTGSEQDADEVVQDSFVKAYKQLAASNRARVSARGCTGSRPTAPWI